MKKKYKSNKRLMKMLRDKDLRARLGDFGQVGQWANGPCVDNQLVKHLKKELDIRTMVDIGCGEGKQVTYARKIGIDAVGVDGCPALKIYKKQYFIRHDYTRGKVDLGNFDLGWSIEFLEHVSAEYIPNFMDTFSKCRFVLCTYAAPGQKGIHHVNCQTRDYWVSEFGKYGLEYDGKETKRIKSKANMSHIKRRGLFLRNVDEKITVSK